MLALAAAGAKAQADAHAARFVRGVGVSVLQVVEGDVGNHGQLDTHLAYSEILRHSSPGKRNEIHSRSSSPVFFASTLTILMTTFLEE